MDKTRIGKWLWAARFFKTRFLATDEVNKGHVQMEGHDIKPALGQIWIGRVGQYSIGANTHRSHLRARARGELLLAHRERTNPRRRLCHDPWGPRLYKI